MKQKLIKAPRIESYIEELRNSRMEYNQKTLTLLEHLFDILDEIEPIRPDDRHKLWITAERGKPEDFGDYQELLDEGEVKNYDDYIEYWKSWFPDEICWYNLGTIKFEDFRAVFVNYRQVIEVNPNRQNWDNRYIEKDVDLSQFLNWLVSEAEKTVEMLKNGEYNEYIDKNLPLKHRTGTIERKAFWDAYPELRERFYNDVSREEVSEFLKNLQGKSDSEEPKERLQNMTAHDFFDYCAIGYIANNYDVGEKTPRKMYYRFADGRDDGLSEIDENSPEEFADWLKNRQRIGHPWEVIPGGNSTHVDFYVHQDEGGYYLALAGIHRAEEIIKFYNALVRNKLPVRLFDSDKFILMLTEKEKMGIVPQGIIPKYCESMFPGEKVFNFFNLESDDETKITSYITWQKEDELKLAKKEN